MFDYIIFDNKCQIYIPLSIPLLFVTSFAILISSLISLWLGCICFWAISMLFSRHFAPFSIFFNFYCFVSLLLLFFAQSNTIPQMRTDNLLLLLYLPITMKEEGWKLKEEGKYVSFEIGFGMRIHREKVSLLILSFANEFLFDNAINNAQYFAYNILICLFNKFHFSWIVIYWF